MKTLTIALAKGRLADEACALFDRCGLDCSAVQNPGRKLILEDEAQALRFILAKPSDVPTYVEYGAADLGVVGKDTLLEAHRNLYEVADLGFGACRLAICGPESEAEVWRSIPHKRVGTKYPHVTRSYFRDVCRESVEIIELNGSVELAPLTGLADMIVDIVESGKTLVENGLCVYQSIVPVSARLIVNRVSMNMQAARLKPLLEAVRKATTVERKEALE